MDDDEMWVPLIPPRESEAEDDLDVVGDPGPRACSENGLAMPSKSLGMASPDVADIPEGVPFPTLRLWGTTHVPDFNLVPPVQWEEALRATPKDLRFHAVQRAVLPAHQFGELLQLAIREDLPPAVSDRVRETIRAKPRLAPTPAADHFRRANRQVNFRLTEAEYLDLATAAQIIGTTPTGLAAQLVRNGVRRVIEAANRPGS